jgi:hypothetical protein
MRHRSSVALAFLAMLSACGGSSTSPSTTTPTPVVTVGGSVVQIAAPADVRIGALSSDTNTRLFTEVLGVTLSLPLTVDFNVPGAYSVLPPVALPAIAAGTAVNSYYLVADAINPPRNFTGTITFDRDVLGVIVLNAEFASSNSVLGRPGTLYAATGIDYELGTGQQDSFTLSADRRTITFNVSTLSLADNMRIVTAK